MRYYNYEMAKRMALTKLDDVLQEFFPDSDKWGACAYFTREGDVDFLEINKLSDVRVDSATWTHFCNIQNTGKRSWEVNTLFNGERENEMWVYGYYMRFRNACRCAFEISLGKRTKIDVYK